MKPRTDDVLNVLLWFAEILARPSFRNLTESYESWAYRKGWFRYAAKLERRHLLERDTSETTDRVYRLTAQGRLRVLGGRDPQLQWSRRWDGRWRLVLFDIPTRKNSERARLRRYLRERGFGYLQNSVWITPDPLENERQDLGDGKVNVESFILMEARPCAGESDTEIVSGAWDFERINRRYARHLRLLEERPARSLDNEPAVRAFLRWASAEREAWLDAVSIDPLLPEAILPAGYLGKRAWRRRVEVLGDAGSRRHTS